MHLHLSRCVRSAYVPSCRQISDVDLETFSTFLSRNAALFCLTGAGISTESGIPDYRSKGVGLYDRENHKPILHQEFVQSTRHRQRYWARNFVGYEYFSIRAPNQTHHAINDLMSRGKIHHLVTQNVDGLHIKAGSRNLVELHGNSHRVLCLDCGKITSRSFLQKLFIEANEHWAQPVMENTVMAPDADAVLTSDQIDGFCPVSCPHCKTGTLKPDVTFFGDNVNGHLVQDCYDKVADSDGVLVVGSSLFVWSGFRFVREAIQLGKDVLVINIGETRADDLARKQNLSRQKYTRLAVNSSSILSLFSSVDSF